MIEYRICSKGIGKDKCFKAQKRKNFLGIMYWYNIMDITYDIAYCVWVRDKETLWLKDIGAVEYRIKEDQKKEMYKNNFIKHPVKCRGIHSVIK